MDRECLRLPPGGSAQSVEPLGRADPLPQQPGRGSGRTAGNAAAPRSTRSLHPGGGGGEHLAHQPLAGRTVGDGTGRRGRQPALSLPRYPPARDRRWDPGGSRPRSGAGTRRRARQRTANRSPGGNRSLAGRTAGVERAASAASGGDRRRGGTPAALAAGAGSHPPAPARHLDPGPRHRGRLRRLRPLSPRPAAGLGSLAEPGDRGRTPARQPALATPPLPRVARAAGAGTLQPAGGTGDRAAAAPAAGSGAAAPTAVRPEQPGPGAGAVAAGPERPPTRGPLPAHPLSGPLGTLLRPPASPQRCPRPGRSPRHRLAAAGASLRGPLRPARGRIPAAAGGHR